MKVCDLEEDGRKNWPSSSTGMILGIIDMKVLSCDWSLGTLTQLGVGYSSYFTNNDSIKCYDEMTS